jgi:hypothetical protein
MRVAIGRVNMVAGHFLWIEYVAPELSENEFFLNPGGRVIQVHAREAEIASRLSFE